MFISYICMLLIKCIWVMQCCGDLSYMCMLHVEYIRVMRCCGDISLGPCFMLNIFRSCDAMVILV